MKNDIKDKKDEKKVDIKKTKSKDEGGGFFSCCGPRQAEIGIESDDDELMKEDSDEEEDN
jgi:hypothetical protein